MNAPEQFCTFYLDGLYFGISVRRVQEVLRLQAMTPVPLAPPTVRGLINLRGQIVTAIDLRRRLDLPPLAEGAEPLNVVVRDDDSAVSLLVDEIGDVIEIDVSMHERPPENLRGPARDLVTSVYKLKQQLLLVIDIDRVVQLATAASVFNSNN